MTRSHRVDDRGFTLVELLLAVVILGVIMYPLGNFVIGYLKNVNQTQNRLSESHDIQIASAYFSQDVANVGLRTPATPYPLLQSVWTPGALPPGTWCASVPASLPGAFVLNLQWDNFTGQTTANTTAGTRALDSVTYYKTGTTLHRVYCSNGTPTGPDLVLAHNLAAIPTVTCSTTCTAAAVPAKVTMTLQIQGPYATAATPLVLIGQRRQGA